MIGLLQKNSKDNILKWSVQSSPLNIRIPFIVQRHISTQIYIYLSKLVCQLSHLPKQHYLKIQKQTCKLSTITKQQLDICIHNQRLKPMYALLIIGIMILNTQIYLLYVSTASVVFKQINNDSIYQVEDVYHLSFRNSFQYKSSRNRKVNEQILKYLEQTILKKNFYFRYRSDITLSIENARYFKKNSDHRFFWNRNLVRIFKQNNMQKCWRIPIMQGFITCTQLQKDSYYLMINRRSKIFSGPKYFSCGIYEHDGESVANYNQTEEIVKFKNDIFSYVSIRGSVPVYWKQNKGSIEAKNDERNSLGFDAHLASIQKSYPEKRIYLISWLTKQENQLREKMDSCFYHSKNKYSQNDKYKLLLIDLDENSKNVLYFLKQKIHKSVNTWFPYKDNFFWSVQEAGQESVMTRQKLIYRVNCLDCTMRTNSIMMQISRKTIRDIEEFISIKKEQNEQYQQLEGVIINAWKQLGNRISRMYCGQEELEIGKKQEASFFSMFTMYKDPLSSQFKHKALEHLLNEFTPKQVLWIQKNLQRKLNILDFCTISKLSFFIFSWNCNNANPLNITGLNKEKILQLNRNKIDIVVFNLQEMVELNTYNILITIDENILTKWKQFITETLNNKIQDNQQKYDFIAEENLVAITTWIFIKNKVKVKHLEKKQTTIVKTGFANGIGGNKGAIVIFLKFDSMWVCLINCHVAAGQGKKLERKDSLQQILYSGLQDKYKQRMSQCDITFLIGDLNFRLQWSQEQIKNVLFDVQKKFNKESLVGGLSHLNKEQLNRTLGVLWQKDQLLNYMKNEYEFLSRFKQTRLIFMPTYKFIKKINFNQYDDKRIPAWCDRILFEEKVPLTINPIKYLDIDINLSDHKPVYGVFEVQIKKIQDKDKYQKKFSQLKTIYYQNTQEQIQIVNKKRNNSIDFFSQIQQEIHTNSKVEKKMNQNQNLLDLDFSQSKTHDFAQFTEFVKQFQLEKKTSQSNNNLLD